MGPEIPNEISIENETNLFPDHSRSVNEGAASLGNDSSAEKEFENNQEVEQVVDNWERLLFSDKRRLSSTDTEKEESEEIEKGLRDAISSIVKMDSNTSKEKSLTAETHSSPDREQPSEADETFALLLDNDGQSSANNNQQPKKIEPRRNSAILGNKRKLRSRKTKESDESDEVTKKRSRRESRNKSGTHSANTSLKNVDRKESNKNNSKIYSGNTGNSSREIYEFIAEDSSDVNTARKSSTNEEESQEEKQPSILPRIAYQNKILKLLNEGSTAELKLLPRIGPKGAMMIHRHREVHGKLRSIKDLKNMRGWSPKFFEQFLQANEIDLD